MSTSSSKGYIVLLLTAKEHKIFIVTNDQLSRIRTNYPTDAEVYKNLIPQKTGNFTNSQDRKEIMLDKFLYQVDKELSDILQNHPLPVILLAPERVAGHFKKLSHNASAITGYIHGNYSEASTSEIIEAIRPGISMLLTEKDKEFVIKIDEAVNTHKFCHGIARVRENSKQHKGSLLLIEKDYPFGLSLKTIVNNVLESGGDIAYVAPAIISRFDHIGLIQYFK